MGLFSAILGKLGFGDDQVKAAEAVAVPASSVAATAAIASTPPAATLPAAISEVDVVAQLTAMASASAQPLNWKTSVVDLLKLLGLDSSLTARKALATELECPAEKMLDSAQMNMWLHKALLQKIAANGGNIPPELL